MQRLLRKFRRRPRPWFPAPSSAAGPSGRTKTGAIYFGSTNPPPCTRPLDGTGQPGVGNIDAMAGARPSRSPTPCSISSPRTNRCSLVRAETANAQLRTLIMNEGGGRSGENSSRCLQLWTARPDHRAVFIAGEDQPGPGLAGLGRRSPRPRNDLISPKPRLHHPALTPNSLGLHPARL